MTLAAWVTVAGLVLVGSTGSGGVVYWLLNRKSQAVVDDKVKADRESTLADAAKKWQEIADESSTKAYKTLEESSTKAFQSVQKQCEECTEKLRGMRDVAGNLIDAMETLLSEDNPQNRADARASVRLARRAMTL